MNSTEQGSLKVAVGTQIHAHRKGHEDKAAARVLLQQAKGQVTAKNTT
jgi:hypothetical protein